MIANLEDVRNIIAAASELVENGQAAPIDALTAACANYPMIKRLELQAIRDIVNASATFIAASFHALSE